MLRYKAGTSKSSDAVFSFKVKLKMVTFTMSCKRRAVICNPVNTVLLFRAHHYLTVTSSWTYGSKPALTSMQ
jgi:hypothetical protein